MILTSIQDCPPDLPQVSIAILYRQDQFLLQLRDDIPGIAYPGYWGFFGGHLEFGETPEAALSRELLEEIGYRVPQATLFGHYPEAWVWRHVFAVPLIVEPEALTLAEGWDLGLFTHADILRGDRYSDRAGQVRPLAPPHQGILLDFIHLRQPESELARD
jgi:8-oxo-dGTP pyrophosphatase MutT (NUDIX family)